MTREGNTQAQESLVSRVYHNNLARIGTGAAIAIGGAGLGLWLTSGEGGASSAESALIQDLTIDQDQVNANCVAIVQEAGTGSTITFHNNGENATFVEPHIGADDGLVNDGHGGDRLWSDAIEKPLPNPDDTVGSKTQIDATLCQDPELVSAFGNELDNTTIDGVNIGTIDPMFNQFAGDATQPINNIAANAENFFPLTDPNGGIYVSQQESTAFQKIAEDEITFLERLQNDGRSTHPTTENYHLSLEGVGANGPWQQIDLNNVQYNADAEWFQITVKTGECLPEFGFNVGDQRPEETDLCGTTTTTGVTPTTIITHNTVPTTTIHRGTTTTSSPETSTTTSTTISGAKQDAHPPVDGGTTTTLPATQPGGEIPTTTTTSTTQPAAGESTPASSTTSTTAPQTVGCAVC